MYEPEEMKFKGRQTGIKKGYRQHYRPNSPQPFLGKLWPCRDGLDCTLRDFPAHCSKYSHPCLFANRCNKKAMEPNLTHEPNRVPQCEYDEKCLKLDDPRHRASFWHSKTSDFLKTCRNHPRCSNSSYDHLSKYSHGEYKIMFNRTPSFSQPQAHRDHQDAHGNRPHKNGTERTSANSTIVKSPERVDRHRSLSTKSSAHDRKKSHSQSSQRSTDSKIKSSVSPHVSRRKSYREIQSNAKETEFSKGNRHKPPVTPSGEQLSPHQRQRSKSIDHGSSSVSESGNRRRSSSSGRSERSPSVPSRPLVSILRHARRSGSREADFRDEPSLERRSKSRSESQ